MLSPYKFIVEQKEDYVQRLNLGEMLSEIESQASCEVNEWVTVISLLYKNDILVGFLYYTESKERCL